MRHLVGNVMNICYIYLGNINEDSAPSIHVREVVKNLSVKNDIFLLVDKGNPSENTNIKVFPMNVPKIKGFTYLFTIFYSFINLKKLINRNKIDIIYCRDIFSSFPAILLSKMKKIPFVFEVNGISSDESKIKKQNRIYISLIKFFEHFIFKNSDAFICVTEKLKEYIEEKYNRKNVYFVSNGVNTDLFKPIKNAKKLLKFDEKFYYVVFVGSFAPWHGIEDLVKSTSLILKELQNIKFLLVGNGKSKEQISQIINDLNLTNNFIFISKVPYKEVPKYINASDVCVILKKREISGSPLKLYEYMGCGKPVIATNTKDFMILKKHNAGVLVEPENSQELAKAIIKLLKNEELRKEMGENGRKYVVENHSWKKIAGRIEEILENIIISEKDVEK